MKNRNYFSFLQTKLRKFKISDLFLTQPQSVIIPDFYQTWKTFKYSRHAGNREYLAELFLNACNRPNVIYVAGSHIKIFFKKKKGYLRRPRFWLTACFLSMKSSFLFRSTVKMSSSASTHSVSWFTSSGDIFSLGISVDFNHLEWSDHRMEHTLAMVSKTNKNEWMITLNKEQ